MRTSKYIIFALISVFAISYAEPEGAVADEAASLEIHPRQASPEKVLQGIRETLSNGAQNVIKGVGYFVVGVLGAIDNGLQGASIEETTKATEDDTTTPDYEEEETTTRTTRRRRTTTITTTIEPPENEESTSRRVRTTRKFIKYRRPVTQAVTILAEYEAKTAAPEATTFAQPLQPANLAQYPIIQQLQPGQPGYKEGVPQYQIIIPGFQPLLGQKQPALISPVLSSQLQPVHEPVRPIQSDSFANLPQIGVSNIKWNVNAANQPQNESLSLKSNEVQAQPEIKATSAFAPLPTIIKAAHTVAPLRSITPVEPSVAVVQPLVPAASIASPPGLSIPLEPVLPLLSLQPVVASVNNAPNGPLPNRIGIVTKSTRAPISKLEKYSLSRRPLRTPKPRPIGTIKRPYNELVPARSQSPSPVRPIRPIEIRNPPVRLQPLRPRPGDVAPPVDITDEVSTTVDPDEVTEDANTEDPDEAENTEPDSPDDVPVGNIPNESKD